MIVEDFVIECRVLPTRPGNESGGSLHVVLDDGNIEREHVEFCRDWARNAGDVSGVALAELLLTLTDEERESACFGGPT